MEVRRGEVVITAQCPCWLDRGWWRLYLTNGEGRCPSSLYCTPYISAGISLIAEVSGGEGVGVGGVRPGWWFLVPTYDNISPCWPSWWFLVPTYDNISPYLPSWWYLLPTYDKYFSLWANLVVSGDIWSISHLGGPLVVFGAHICQYFTLWANLVVSGAHLSQYITL